MIENHVHHYLQVLFMRFLHQRAEIFITSETPVNLVIVRNGISMIRTAFHVIFLRRVQPDSRRSQISDIVQMVRYALKVSAVTGKSVRAVHRFLPHPVYHVIFRTTVSETVGHNQVKYIFRSKTFHLFAFPPARFQLIRNPPFLFSALQQNLKGLRLCFRQIKIEQQIIRIVLPYCFFQINPFARHAYIRQSQLFAIQQNLKLRIFHSCPPERRSHFLYLHRPGSLSSSPQEKKRDP